MENIRFDLKELSFKEDNKILTLQNNGVVQEICLNHVCGILSRSEMITNGEAMKLCKTSRSISVRKKVKRWFTHRNDLQPLFNKVSKESGRLRTLCTELENWIAELPYDTIPKKILREPVVFQFNNKNITFRVQEDRLFVNATEIGNCFNQSPYIFLRRKDTVQYRDKLVQDNYFLNLEEQVFITRGSHGGTWMEESLALKYAEYLISENNKKNDRIINDEFISWFIGCFEKISSMLFPESNVSGSKKKIKKEEYAEPETLEEAKIIIKELFDELEENFYKIQFYDDFIDNREYFRSASIADILDISVVKLNRFLRENDICIYKNKQYIARDRALQCEVPYLYTCRNGKTYAFGKGIRWTPAGRDYVIEVYKRKNKNN